MNDPSWIAGHLDGRRSGAGWMCRCPVEDHRKHPRPLWVCDGDITLLVKCFAGCDTRDVLCALRERGLLDNDDDRRRNWTPRPSPAAKPDKPADPAKLHRIFAKALPINGSPVERYLIEIRGCTVLPPHSAVRYLPARPPDFPWPSMVSLVTDFTDAGRVLTLHLTNLLPDGSGKAPITPNKRTLKGYPTKGGVVRLADDAEVTQRLGIAEGIETSLAVMTAFRDDGPWAEPVWCALNAGNMAELPVLAGVEVLTIYADRGKAGEQAAYRLADRWLAAGRDVFVAVAPVDDWNPEAT